MKAPTAKKLPSGQWYCRVRVNGEDVSITRPTEKEAVAEAMAIKAGIKKAQQKSSKITLGDAMDEYISSRRGILSASTIRGYKDIRKNRFLSLMDRQLSSITKAQYQAEIKRMASITSEKTKKSLSPKTIRSAWALLCSVLRENGIVPPDVNLPAKIPNPQEFLDEEQIPIFLEAIRGTPAELFLILALHGLRRSEIMALKRSSIDLSRGLIYVRGAKVEDEDHNVVYQRQNKNETSTRDVPILIPRLIELYNEIDSDSLINIGLNTAYNTSRRCCLKAGLPIVGVHGLRHSFASLCYAKDIPAKITQRLGGWKNDATMMKIYTHISDRKVSEKVRELKSYFTELPE